MRAMVVRSSGARLAVPLIVLAALALTGAGVILPSGPAVAAEGCAYSIDGIDCWYGATSTTTSTLPPYRYLRTREEPGLGTCWYWSRYPPGLDADDPRTSNDIIDTRLRHPECPTGAVTSRAWEVFRSFPLRVPSPVIRPTVGITNLESILTAVRPPALRHVETLPDGRVLEVEAYVWSVPVSWGDGSAVTSVSAWTASADGARHAYARKTCPPWYRRDHPAGPGCHPELEAYPITVSFAWLGRYRSDGASWVTLGTLYRSSSLDYDVDEVVGIPIRP